LVLAKNKKMINTLEAYKFIRNKKFEYHFIDDDKDVICFIEFDELTQFCEVFKTDRLTDDPPMVALKSYCIGIEMAQICDYFGVDLDDIFDKDKEF
jgi:hypothetical protein